MAKVLIIDDEAAILDVFAEAFQAAGHTVFKAVNGTTGVDIFDNETLDLVVVDVFMPEKDGIETLLEIRTRDKDVPIIAMSGGGRSQHFQFLDMTRKLGASRTLKKPILPKDLVATATEYLKAGKQ